MITRLEDTKAGMKGSLEGEDPGPDLVLGGVPAGAGKGLRRVQGKGLGAPAVKRILTLENMLETAERSLLSGSIGKHSHVTLSYYEYIDKTFKDEINQRKSSGRSFSATELYFILQKIVCCGDFLVTQGGSKGRHGDIRPRNIAWDGQRSYRLMENVKNRPGRGPQASYLMKADKEVFMSPEYFRNMDEIQDAIDRKYGIGESAVAPQPEDYEKGYGITMNYDREKNDVWALGATLLYAGNLESIRPMYNDFKKDVDDGVKTELLNKFKAKYGHPEAGEEKKGVLNKLTKNVKELARSAPEPGSKELCEWVTKMLEYKEGKRPRFAEIKAAIAPDVTLEEDQEDPDFTSDNVDPFGQIDNYRQGEMEQKKLTQKELDDIAMKRLAEDPVYGGVFGIQNAYRGKRTYGKEGIGGVSLHQAKALESLDYVNPRNQQFFQKNRNFVPDLDHRHDFGRPKMSRVQANSTINRRYFS